MEEILVPIFVVVDDFIKEYEEPYQLGKRRARSCSLSKSEIMAILVAFHHAGTRNFKKYYQMLLKHYRPYFPRLPSYQRFIELKSSVLLPLCGFFLFIKGECSGIGFIDATALSVCKNKRIHSHKVFKGLAKVGKTTMGWFLGFKLHLVVNHLGIPVSFRVTPGNRDDRKASESLLKNFWGKIYADKGYLSKELFDKLFKKGVQLVTARKKNMKPEIVTETDSIYLGKRSGIESIFNVLKNVQHLEHSRHRSITGFLINIVTSINAFTLKTKGFLNLKLLKNDS